MIVLQGTFGIAFKIYICGAGASTAMRGCIVFLATSYCFKVAGLLFMWFADMLNKSFELLIKPEATEQPNFKKALFFLAGFNLNR